jgi:hypothetical protein
MEQKFVDQVDRDINAYMQSKGYTENDIVNLIKKYSNQTVFGRTFDWFFISKTSNRITIINKLMDCRKRNHEYDDKLFITYYECYNSISYGLWLKEGSSLEKLMNETLGGIKSKKFDLKLSIDFLRINDVRLLSLVIKEHVLKHFNEQYAKKNAPIAKKITDIHSEISSEIFSPVGDLKKYIWYGDPQAEILKVFTDYDQLNNNLDRAVYTTTTGNYQKFVNGLKLEEIFALGDAIGSKVLFKYSNNEHIEVKIVFERLLRIFGEACSKAIIELQEKGIGKDISIQDREMKELERSSNVSMFFPKSPEENKESDRIRGRSDSQEKNLEDTRPSKIPNFSGHMKKTNE